MIVENQYYKLKRDDIVYLYGINNISLNAYSSLKKKDMILEELSIIKRILMILDLSIKIFLKKRI